MLAQEKQITRQIKAITYNDNTTQNYEKKEVAIHK